MKWILFSILAWTTTAGFGQYPFERPFILTEEEGLSSNYVTCIEKDRDGFIWIGTADGVNRFDGRVVRPYFSTGQQSNIHQNLVFDVFCDKDGRVWMSSVDGLSRFSPKKEKFEAFPRKAEEKTKGLWYYAFLQDRQGRIWLGANKGGLRRIDVEKDTVYRFELRPEGEFTEDEFNAINNVYAVEQSPAEDSILWLGTRNGLVRYNTVTRRSRLYRFQGKSPESTPAGNQFRSVFCHKNGQIYIGAQNTLLVFDPVKDRFSVICGLNTAPGPRYATFNLVSKDILWYTYEQGLIICNLSTGKVEKEYLNVFDKDKIYGAELVDQEGRLWARSPGGLFLYKPISQQIKTWQHENFGNPNYAYIVQGIVDSRDGKTIYLCENLSDGIFAFNRQTEEWSVIRPPGQFVYNQGFQGMHMTRLRNGRILVVEPHNLFELDEKNRRLVRLPLDPAFSKAEFNEILEDSRGVVWVSTRKEGLLKVDPETWKVIQYKETFNVKGYDKRHELIFGLLEDDFGNIWMRTSPGYSVYQYAKDSFVHVAQTPFADGQNDRELHYTCFAKDGQGNIWAGSGDLGICMFNPREPEKGVAKWYDSANGLPSFPINMVSDQHGRIWISGNKSLIRFDTKTGDFQEYGPAYGYVLQNNVSYISRLSSGEIAIAASKGFSLFDPAKIWLNAETPKPYITGVRIFDQKVGLEGSFQQLSGMKLSYRQNFFSFDLSAIAFNQPEAVRFAYQLEGVDQDWVQAGDRRFASYTNISGGRYTFRVKAANSEGVWNEEPVSIRIRISTPWWRAWWFYTFAGLALAGLIIWVYRSRLEQFKKQQSLKTEYEKKLANVKMDALRSQINPHFIFNCLNSIDYYIIKNESQKASEYLNQFSRLIRLILQNSSANSVTLKDELEALQLYMQMESLRFNHRFDYVVKVEKGLNLDAIEIPPMLLQPYVENAIWHGLMHKEEKGRISVEVTRENGSLSFAIEDNGIGRKQAEALKSRNITKKRSMGMNITQNRIELLNQMFGKQTTIKIIDLEDENNLSAGTRVELSIPIN